MMSINVRVIALIALTFASVEIMGASAPPSGAEYFPVADLPASMNLPFSEAVRVGDMLYVAGTVGLDKSGKLVSGGMPAEAKQAMDNIAATLKRHGSSFDNAVQCAVALADIKDWPAFNEVYRHYFTTHFPARMAFATSGLAFDARVEVQCNATVGAR